MERHCAADAGLSRVRGACGTDALVAAIQEDIGVARRALACPEQQRLADTAALFAGALRG